MTSGKFAQGGASTHQARSKPGAAPTGRRLLQLFLLTASILLGDYFLLDWVAIQIKLGDYLGDFQMFWRYAQMPVAGTYTPVALARDPNNATFVFPYPPTSLLLIRPFGNLAFPAALLTWSVLGLLAMFAAARRIMAPQAILIGFATMAALSAAISGQMSLFVGALILGGLSSGRPWVAGVLLGCAAMIKPQSLIAAPFALLAARQYRTIGWACVTSALLFLLTVALWGTENWLRWVEGVTGFHNYLQNNGIDREDKGLYGLAVQFGLPGWLFLLGLPLGIACKWRVFHRESLPIERYAAFAASTILMSPYTLGYDLAGLSIVCAGLLLDKDRSIPTWIAAALVISGIFANVGVLLLGFVLLLGRLAPRGPDDAGEIEQESGPDRAESHRMSGRERLAVQSDGE